MAKNGNIHPTRIFKEPNDIYKAFNEYKEQLKQKSSEWLKVQYVGKEGGRVTDEQKLPLTLDGFEVFCYDKYGCVEQYFKNQDGYYDDFIPICSRIRKEIRDNQILGGMLGFYNASITQRLNNLHEKVVSTNTNINHNSEDLSQEDIKKISDELENDY